MPQSRTNLNPEPKHSRPYITGLLLRYSTFGASILIFLAGLLLINWWLIVIGGLAVGLGIYDLVQSKHSILNNYPVAGHIRYVLEDFRPEIRQYLLEDDKEQVPFSRQQRALVYQRAKGVSDTNAFGTLDDLYAHGKEWF
ncbi:FMN-binding glutamate synthase family protein, partial [Psychrobacter sp. 1U2]